MHQIKEDFVMCVKFVEMKVTLFAKVLYDGDRMILSLFANNNDKQSDAHALQSRPTIKCVKVLKVEIRQIIFVELWAICS